MAATVTAHMGDVFEGGADLTVLPCGAKPSWTSGVTRWIEQFNLPSPKQLSDRMAVGDVTPLAPFPGPPRLTRYVAYAAAVLNDKSSSEAVRLIGCRIGEITCTNPEIRLVESVLFGTGHGGLDDESAASALASGFIEKGHPEARLCIHVQGHERFRNVLKAIIMQDKPDAATPREIKSEPGAPPPAEGAPVTLEPAAGRGTRTRNLLGILAVALAAVFAFLVWPERKPQPCCQTPGELLEFTVHQATRLCLSGETVTTQRAIDTNLRATLNAGAGGAAKTEKTTKAVDVALSGVPLAEDREKTRQCMIQTVDKYFDRLSTPAHAPAAKSPVGKDLKAKIPTPDPKVLSTSDGSAGKLAHKPRNVPAPSEKLAIEATPSHPPGIVPKPTAAPSGNKGDYSILVGGAEKSIIVGEINGSVSQNNYGEPK